MLWSVVRVLSSPIPSQSKCQELYRPAIQIDREPWKRLETPTQILTKDNEIELHFEQYFSHES